MVEVEEIKTLSPSVSLSVCLCLSLPLSLSLCVSLSLSLSLSLSVSVSVSVTVSLCLSLYLSLSLSLSLGLSLSLSLSLSLGYGSPAIPTSRCINLVPRSDGGVCTCQMLGSTLLIECAICKKVRAEGDKEAAAGAPAAAGGLSRASSKTTLK